MKNPYPNTSIASIPFDSDGEAGVLTYVFGHECPLDDFSAQLQAAAVAWTQSAEAREYVDVQGSYGIDWQEMLNAMSDEHLALYDLANIGSDIGTVGLSDDVIFDLPEIEDEDDAEVDG